MAPRGGRTLLLALAAAAAITPTSAAPPPAIPAAAAAPRPLASVNIVQALWNAWGTDGQTVEDTRLAATAACRDRGFTAVRIAASPFWPNEWALYASNKTAFFAAAREGLDALVAGGCTRIVATLFWNTFALPDLYGEPLSALPLGARGAGPSRSFAASLTYIDEFVGVAKGYPIAAYELTNELNLLYDLDQSQFCNCCSPPHGTPAARTCADNVSTDDGSALLDAWAARVRAADPGRPVTTGHGMARPAAEHLRASYLLPGRDWRLDSFAQFSRNLQDITSCCEWASAHVYPGADNARWNATGPDDGRIVWWLQAAAAAVHKRLLIGEYGQLPAGDPAAPRPFVDSVLAALAAPQPPGVAGVTELALLWVWELSSQNGTTNDGWAVWPGVSQGVVDALVRYNAA